MRDVFPRDHARARAAREAFDYRARRCGLDGRDRGFAAELAYGSLKARRFLDWILKPYVGERATTLPPTILEILRLGAYQLCGMSVEARAAVSESVGLAKKFGHKGTAGLVNAVLRRVAEERDRRPQRAEFDSGDEYLATLHSFPTWIVATLRRGFGDAALEAMLAGMNQPARAALRVNLLRGTRAEALAALAERGIAAHPSELVGEMIVLDEGASSAQVEDAELRWDQQGEIAAVPVDLLDPLPGERVLELCAGRGNKTLQIAARIGAAGSVDAVERDAYNLARARDRLAALAIENVCLIEADAAALAGEADADRVLLDAPCSGLGILGRQPEARWRKEPGDPERLAQLQAALLSAAARRVRPGGRLVYSVCSVDPREGAERIAALLDAAPDFRRAPLPPRYLPWETAERDLLFPPGIDGRDGFFVAVLERLGNEPVRGD